MLLSAACVVQHVVGMLLLNLFAGKTATLVRCVYAFSTTAKGLFNTQLKSDRVRGWQGKGEEGVEHESLQLLFNYFDNR